MDTKNSIGILKGLNILSWMVPIAAVLASALFPLKPIIQQGLVGVIMIWFIVMLMNGFSVWR